MTRITRSVGRKRRSWTRDEKRRIVAESHEEGASIAEVARRHEVNANLLFTWRRKMGVERSEQSGTMPLLPVTIAPDPVSEGRCPDAAGGLTASWMRTLFLAPSQA